jgi:hypothetical protein
MIKKRDYLLICMLAIALTAPAATSLHNDIVAPIMPDDTTLPTIDGPHAGKVNTNYTFTIGPITDPEGDQFYFFLDWGDGTTSGWQGPIPPVKPVLQPIHGLSQAPMVSD